MATASNDSRDGDSEAEPMDVEDDAVYAKRHGDNMEVSGPDKEESEQMANADWEQLGETTKSKENREKFVRDTAKTYEKARRSDYVRECRTGVQQRRREWKKAKKRGTTGRYPKPHRTGRRKGRGRGQDRRKRGGWRMAYGGTPSPQERTRRADCGNARHGERQNASVCAADSGWRIGNNEGARTFSIRSARTFPSCRRQQRRRWRSSSAEVGKDACGRMDTGATATMG